MLFPTSQGASPDCGISKEQIYSCLHDISTLVFFGAIGAMAWHLFAKSNHNFHNWIYKGCALLISACIVPLVVWNICPDLFPSSFEAHSAKFWLESLAVWAFAAAWLFKATSPQ